MAAPQARLNWNRAASSADPAPGVEQAMLEGLRANDGKRSSAGIDERVQGVRQLACALFDWPHPEGVVFTPGATHALNQAIACIPNGDTVWASALEHNSSLRPLHLRQSRNEIAWTQGGFQSDGRIDLDELHTWLAAQQPEHCWVVLSLASNVFGTIQPVAEAAELCHEHRAKLVLDLAQGAGHLTIPLDTWKPWFAAVPAHKGLGGPQGIGLLFVNPNEQGDGLLTGGTGLSGESLDMPRQLPLRFEAGTPNLPGIYGLGAALQWRAESLADLAPARAQMHWLEEQLRRQGCWQVLPEAPVDWEQRLPLLSLASQSAPPQVVCALLEQAGIEARAGMLCAALAARHAHPSANEGVLRLSPPVDVSRADCERVLAALAEAAQALGVSIQA